MSDPNEPTTLGAYLREARRRKRVSLERAAEQTRIRADFLMRMESDDFDFLAPAYVRGFLSSYARFLGLPIEVLLEEFDRRFGTGRVDTAQMIAMDRKRAKVPGERRFGPVAIILFAAAALLLIFAVIGLANDPGSDSDGPQAAVNPTRTPRATETPRETETETPTPVQSFTPPSPTTEPPEIANKAIELQVVASRGNCWVQVAVADSTVFQDTIFEGEFRFFTADAGEDMTVVLDSPADVDLILDGDQLPVQDSNEPITFTLPDDLELLGG